MFFRTKSHDKQDVAPSSAKAAKASSGPEKGKNGAAPVERKSLDAGATSKTAARQPDLDAEKARQAASRDLMAALGGIVSVLMRSKQFGSLTLADLEALVVPALLRNKFSVASVQANSNGLLTPAAVVLWAEVSTEVDQRLSQNLEQPMRLATNEWHSGDIPWLVAAAGNPRGIDAILKQLSENRLKGKTLKIRGKNKDGKEVVGNVSSKPATELHKKAN